MAGFGSEFRVYAVRNRLKAELQTLLSTNRISMQTSIPSTLNSQLSTLNSQLFPMRLFIHVPSQTLDLLDDSGALLRRYACSTSKFGPGSEPGSHRTPVGKFRIAEKHGHDAPAGMIFKSRQPTGEIGRPGDTGDHVQTRILWLDGLDAANANTKERFIYIHGTNAEHLLGTPASHGCVRLSNQDMIDLFETVGEETEVVIDASE